MFGQEIAGKVPSFKTDEVGDLLTGDDRDLISQRGQAALPNLRDFLN